MLKLILSLFISLFVVSCGGPQYVNSFPSYGNVKADSNIALVPVMVPANIPEACELSRELTDKIRCEMMNHGQLLLLADSEVQQGLAHTGLVEWLSDAEVFVGAFCDADFVMLTELLHVPVTPYTANNPFPGQKSFVVKMRVRVIDLRPECPKILMQEILTCDFPVPCSQEELAAGVLNWSPGASRNTALGWAHQRIICQVIERVEQVMRSAY